jgi:dipeptide transport system ATP-binding protein
MVMYLGRPIEQGSKPEIFAQPVHPYTQALLAATPSIDPEARSRRLTVKGELPSPINPPSGCAFHKRCPFATDLCSAERPELRPVAGRQVACHHAEKAIAG